MGVKVKMGLFGLLSAVVIGACALPSLGGIVLQASPTLTPVPEAVVSPTAGVMPSVPSSTGATGLEAFQGVL